MSTLIGMPAAKVDVSRFPFAAAVLSNDESAARYADEAARSCALGIEAFLVLELRDLAKAARLWLIPRRYPVFHTPTLVGLSAEQIQHSRFD